MDVRRSVSTRFWSDSWIEELNSDEKLLWLYLLTNQNTNMLGIYELPTMKRISFETGLTIQSLSKAFEGFERIRKAFILQGKFVFMPNWVKNQSFNPNMLKSAKKAFADLSTDLKTDLYNLGVESFESLSKGLVTLPKIEIEIEKEIESENEKEVVQEKPQKRFSKPSLIELQSYCLERKNTVDAQRFFDYYESNGWRVGKNPMKDWKASVRTWEKSDINNQKPQNGQQSISTGKSKDYSAGKEKYMRK